LSELVVGEGEDTLDVGRTATEPNGEVGWRGAAVAPAQEPALEGSEPQLWSWSAASGKVREPEHTFDVLAAAFEPPTDLAGGDACGREPTHSTFERPQVHEIVHERDRTAFGSIYSDGRRRSTSSMLSGDAG